MDRRINRDELLRRAAEMLERAYVPYSHYRVGAAVLGKSGRIYAACNVENVSYGLAVCAERAAIFKAVSEGETEFDALAVVTSNGGMPCGACRQVYYEFTQPDAQVIVGDTSGRVLRLFTIGELLAHGFGPNDLTRP